MSFFVVVFLFLIWWALWYLDVTFKAAVRELAYISTKLQEIKEKLR
jgi:hypothetical protein